MVGLIGLLGGLADAVDNNGTPSTLTQWNQNMNPQETALANYYTQNAQGKNLENQQNAASQSALQQATADGVTNPLQLFGKVAAVNPSYLKDFATAQASNPLGFSLAAGNQGASPLASMQGEDLLKALPPQIASTIKGYGENRIAFNPRLASTPQGQTMLGLITQAYPDFDAADQPARVSTRKSFVGDGKNAQNITALNTAMGHAAALQDAYEKLDNGDYPLLNKIENKTAIATGDTKVQDAAADVAAKGHALSGELAKVFRSTGMAEADIKAWEDKLDVNATPAQQKATLGAAMELMDSRLDALGEQYNQGYRSSKQGYELLSPKAQAAYLKVKGEAPAATLATGQGGTMTAPAATASNPVSVVSPDGKVGTIDASELQDALANGWKKK